MWSVKVVSQNKGKHRTMEISDGTKHKKRSKQFFTAWLKFFRSCTQRQVKLKSRDKDTGQSLESLEWEYISLELTQRHATSYESKTYSRGRLDQSNSWREQFGLRSGFV
ncbi:hypothetical protein HOLleu_26972 [Holothuria leucospilota]|uniref:Uncharacterized protein n=1 Tax=Holothuria leucospilota TaxID=206669 RepID=A0A9Q1H1Z0_HOLLE|nr:hypothetical protein HOLleu_26972 [Holothuria leucospilota]